MATGARPGEQPEHTVRVSDRAKRIRLVMSARDGLVVVVPRGVSARRVPEVLATHALWIERASARLADRRARLDTVHTEPVPSRIDMPGIGVSWRVRALPGPGDRVRGRVRDGELVLSGATSDAQACRDAIRRAVSRVARERLPLVLGGFEAETGWRSSRVAVRRQRTRWGSCSAAGSVSLNEALVFLPGRLVRFVMIHELAHTMRMDHSPRFWALVETHESEWRACRRELRDAWRHVPAWAEV